jgi:riboflavin kinase/FMN adenylyltransferase
MQVFHTLDDARGRFAPSAVTIGNFDGVHAGHRALLRAVVRLAAARGAKPSVLTFHPHPALVVAPERAPHLLSTPKQRCEWMREAGIEQVLILPFDAALRAMTAEEFFERVLIDALGARALAVGDNFLFGRGQGGNASWLVEAGAARGVAVEVVPAVRLRGVAVSSSAVRRLVEAGDVAKAARLLERPFALTGEVVAGAGRGRRETVPTLNLEIDSLDTERAVLPAHGVYITRTCDLADGRAWPSITNIGIRPTFGGRHVTIETYLLRPLIGETPARIRVELLRRVRDERTFASAAELRAQILRDVMRAETFFRRTARLGR